MKNIVLLGGGSGVSHLIQSLKTSPNLRITALISTSDNGKSTGLIRQSYDVPALGDIRKNLSALADDTAWMEYRFTGGFLDGHPTGNIWLLGLIEEYGMAKGIKKAHQLLNLSLQRVIPTTTDVHDMVALLENGREIRGEWDIDKTDMPIKKFALSRTVHAETDALDALREADMIVVGPGTFYTSILSCFLIDEISQAFRSSKAKKVYIANLLNHPREQYKDFTLQQYLDEFERHIGNIQFDSILAHNGHGIHGSEIIAINDSVPNVVQDDFLSPGSSGLHDAQKVLQWINKNI